jgi:hypothetical protein
VAKDDWYRGPIWDLATREHFEQRLSRARTQRAQYLRIKGYELSRADDRSVWAAGRGLLQRVLDEHPDDKLCVIQAHHDLGRSLAREDAYTEAAHHYEHSLALQRQRWAGVDPGTRLTLAELIVDAGWEHRYQEAIDLLGDFNSSRAGLFPNEQFRVLLVEARIAERLGKANIARRDAEQPSSSWRKTNRFFRGIPPSVSSAPTRRRSGTCSDWRPSTSPRTTERLKRSPETSEVDDRREHRQRTGARPLISRCGSRCQRRYGSRGSSIPVVRNTIRATLATRAKAEACADLTTADPLRE